MSKEIFPDGRYFEHFQCDEVIEHAVPRTVTDGDVAQYQALYGGRHPLYCARPFAQNLGLPDMPVHDWLVFHLVFGKSVADISRHAVANLGYADGRFLKPVFVGDTLRARSRICGLRQNKSGESGLVMVETQGLNQHDETVLSYRRWVMVKKRDIAAAAPQTVWPENPDHVAAKNLPAPLGDFTAWQTDATGSRRKFDDFEIGEKIAHGDGSTIEEAEHMMATRLYQNNAAVHFDAQLQQQSRFDKRLVYGGHVISHAHALSFNGLGNLGPVLALNGGSHAAPCFAGDTLYGWSEILDRAEWPGRRDVGAVRLRHVMQKNQAIEDFALRDGEGRYAAPVVLDFDVWYGVPR